MRAKRVVQHVFSDRSLNPKTFSRVSPILHEFSIFCKLPKITILNFSYLQLQGGSNRSGIVDLSINERELQPPSELYENWENDFFDTSTFQYGRSHVCNRQKPTLELFSNPNSKTKGCKLGNSTQLDLMKNKILFEHLKNIDKSSNRSFVTMLDFDLQKKGQVTRVLVQPFRTFQTQLDAKN